MVRKVTALTAQKRDRNRVNVFLDGEFAFGLARIVAAWLQVGQELSEEKIAALQAEDAREVAFQKAVNFLSYRDRTEAEVRKHLRERGLPEENIEHALERLRRSRLIDDRRFVEKWVENRNEFRPRSRRALAYELKQKGISEDAIQEALDQHDEESMAYQAAAKQAGKLADLDWQQFRQKMYAFLARRGFSYEVSAQAVTIVWQELHEEEN
jgi:regulatory protein